MSTTNENDKPVWAMSVIEKRAKAHSLEVSKLLANSFKELSSVLGSEDSARRFARIGTQAAINNPDLVQCSPASIVSVLLDCAALDLEPNTALGEAWVIPFKDRKAPPREDGRVLINAQLMIGRDGWRRIASRTGVIESADAHAIFERDRFWIPGEHAWVGEMDLGVALLMRGEAIQVHPVSEDPGIVIAAYAEIVHTSGTVVRKLALKHQIEQARKKAAAGSGMWNESYDMGAEKYILKRTLKVGYSHLEQIRDAIRREAPDEPVTIDVSPAKVARLAPAAQDRIPEIGLEPDGGDIPIAAGDPGLFRESGPATRQTVDVVAEPATLTTTESRAKTLATVAQRAPIAQAVKAHLGGNRERALEIAHELWDVERWDQITAEQVAPLVAAIEAEGAAKGVKSVIDEARKVAL